MPKISRRSNNPQIYTSRYGRYGWYVKNHVIDVWIEQALTNKSAVFFDENLTEMLDSARSRQVYVLIDTTKMTQVNTTPSAAVEYLQFLNHWKTAKVIIYGVTGSMQAIMSMLLNVLNSTSQNKIVIVDNRADGLSMIRELDPSIPAA